MKLKILFNDQTSSLKPQRFALITRLDLPLKESNLLIGVNEAVLELNHEVTEFCFVHLKSTYDVQSNHELKFESFIENCQTFQQFRLDHQQEEFPS